MEILNKLKSNYWLLAILVLGSVLRFYHLDFQSPWLDEIHTLNEANPETQISSLYDSILGSEQMPPLYFFIIHLLFKIFGYTIYVARFFSAIVGLLSIYYLYALGKELIGKKVGLVAAFLLSINFFHIYHSQDARPYSLLLLFSIISFFWLLKLLKVPSLKNSIYYGLFVGLMISTHFFGLFVAFSHFIIAVLFLLYPNFKVDFARLKYFIISALIAIILFIPSYKALKKATEIKEFWIPKPEYNAFELIYKEFFNNSETILFISSVFGILYILSLLKIKQTKNKEELLNSSFALCFVLIFVSITSILLIPFIRSYTSVPMILSRYFIVLVPLLLILFSIGINQIENSIVKKTLLLIFLTFTIVDIFIVFKYYDNPKKAQFREVTEFIFENNAKYDPIVSPLNWYLTYFVKDNKTQLISNQIDDYVLQMKSDTTLIKPFWYFGGHNMTYEVKEETQSFLDDHFYLESNYDGFQAWTKHFILKKDAPKTINLTEYINNTSNYNAKFFIEKFEVNEKIITINGWGFIDKLDSNKTETLILISKEGENEAKIFNKQTVIRTDVTSSMNSGLNYDLSGFSASFSHLDLPNGKYKISLLFKSKDNDIYLHNFTDKIFEK